MTAVPDPKFYDQGKPKQGKKDRQQLRQEERSKDPRQIALDRCDDLIEWYEANMNSHRLNMAWSRLTAIVLSGLVPVLVIVQMSIKENTSWWLFMSVLIAAFPATAAIISGMNELFQYKENWLRFTETSEYLKSEKAKYLSRTTKSYDKALDEYTALSNFVTKVETITLRETRKWKSQAEQAKELDEMIKNLNPDEK